MKVLVINGSPRAKGNTFKALELCAKTLNDHGIETEIFQIGTKPIHGCTGCRACKSNEQEYCIFTDDITNELIEKMRYADGIIVGSPVYFAGLAGSLKCFLDRAFYSNSRHMRFKPCAAIAVARRAGSTSTFDQINHYFALGEMINVPTVYWSDVYGEQIGEIEQDKEGLNHVEIIGHNMAWLLKTLEAGKEKVPVPERIKREKTNFIR
ncbi:MAG: flavodoxin family protein [Clostridia bacterium]